MLSVGDKVIHTYFGEGIILEINPQFSLPYLVTYSKQNFRLHRSNSSQSRNYKPRSCYYHQACEISKIIIER